MAVIGAVQETGQGSGPLNGWLNELERAPHPPEVTKVEGCGQHGPLGRHVGEAAQQEPPCPLLLLDDSEDRFDVNGAEMLGHWGGGIVYHQRGHWPA